jgi:type II secretory pathway pseudopilin PulG
MARAAKVFKWILIVVVLVVVALLVANSMMNRMSGPPADALNISDLRSLNTALHTYQSTFGHFPDSLQDLGVAASGPSSEHGSGLIGSRLASGKAHGYRYSYAKTAQGYSIHADPDGAENNVHMFTDESSELRFQRKKPAGRDSPLLP